MRHLEATGRFAHLRLDAEQFALVAEGDEEANYLPVSYLGNVYHNAQQAAGSNANRSSGATSYRLCWNHALLIG